MTAKPTVVLVYQRTTLPWIFDAAERAGIDLVLVPRPDETLPESLPAAVAEVLPLDPTEPEEAIETLRERHRDRPLDGVTTLYDPAVPFAAAAAEELGLPGIGTETARAAQDKRLMRERFAKAGLNVPRFAVLEGDETAADLRFPVVVKPAHGYSSLGVVRVDDPRGLPEAVAEVRRAGRGKVDDHESLVVEEYLDGPEYAVESLAHRGEVEILTVGYKGNPTGPYFEETVYRAPAPLPAPVLDAVAREVRAAHAALGLTDGPAHTELRLRGGTEPYLLELGARVGGSGVSHYIAWNTVGADLAADALRIAAGLEPEPPERRRRPPGAAANYIVPCGGSGRIRAVDGLDEVRAEPCVDHVVQMLHPGDVVKPYPEFTGYPAFVLSHHRTSADSERFHVRLEEAVRIEYGL